MTTKVATPLRIRALTRREKTVIRQDVKRFEKIGRDHHCHTLEDFATFVRERLRIADTGQFTPKSLQLVGGLTAYFGDRLIRATDFIRIATTPQAAPGWMLRDPSTFQTVFVLDLIIEHVIAMHPWEPTLDDIRDELVDWNAGYTETVELFTDHVWDPDTGLNDYLVA